MPPPASATYQRLRDYILATDLPGNSQPGPGAGRGPAERVIRLVGKVLTGSGITCYGNGVYSLICGDELSDCVTWPKASVAEPLRDELLQLCRQRLVNHFVLSGG
jgi:hypothetical protein